MRLKWLLPMLWVIAQLAGCGHIHIVISGTADLGPTEPFPRSLNPYLLPLAPPYNVLKSGDVRWRIESNAFELGPSEGYFMGIEISEISTQENKNRYYREDRLEISIYAVSLRPGVVIDSPSGIVVQQNGVKVNPIRISVNAPEFEGLEMNGLGIKSIRIPLVTSEDPLKWSGYPKFKFIYDIPPDPYAVLKLEFGEISGEKVVFYFSPKIKRVRNFR